MDSNQLSILFSAVAICIGGFVTYFSTARKVRADQKRWKDDYARSQDESLEHTKIDKFVQILKANESLGHEVRMDLKSIKKENTELKSTIEDFGEQLAEYSLRVKYLESQVVAYEA